MSFSSFVNKWIFQFAHVGWGAYLSHLIGTKTHKPLAGLLAVVVFGAIKEFVFDPLTETASLSGGWKGDALDFVFWCVGAVLGYITAL